MVDFLVSLHESELVSDTLWSLGVVAIEEIAHDSEHVTLRTSLGRNPLHEIESITEMYPNVKIEQTSISRDIADTWREFAQPTWVNDKIVIVPAWLDSPEAQVSILIEPADTFGLGNHPTTILAMRLIVEHIPHNTHVLDLGCGSGILAIGASLVRQCSSIVYDIAHGASSVVAYNCTLNKISNVQWSADYARMRFGAVIANILAPVLREQSEVIRSSTQDGGLIVLSGMRTEQLESVLGYFPGCQQIQQASLDGWTAVVLQKMV